MFSWLPPSAIGAETMIKATLCYIVKNGRILLIRKKQGFGAGKLNAPGGKINDGESFEACVARELKEEIGITPLRPQLLAEIEFFNDNTLQWHVYVFRSSSYTGSPKETAEAKPHWFDVDKIPYDEMWADDKIWLPLFLQGKSLKARFYFENDWKDMVGYEID